MFPAGELIGIADDSLSPVSGENAVLNDNFPRGVGVQPGPLAAVFSLAVFTDKDHIDILRPDVL